MIVIIPPSLRPRKKKMPITHTSILLTRPMFASCVLQEYRDGREQGNANVNKELCIILVGCFYNVNQALENWIHITKTAAKDVPVIYQTFSFDRLVYHFSNESLLLSWSASHGPYDSFADHPHGIFIFFVFVSRFFFFACHRPLTYNKLLISTLRQRIASLQALMLIGCVEQQAFPAFFITERLQ